jgi:hypothetical protein
VVDHVANLQNQEKNKNEGGREKRKNEGRREKRKNEVKGMRRGQGQKRPLRGIQTPNPRKAWTLDRKISKTFSCPSPRLCLLRKDIGEGVLAAFQNDEYRACGGREADVHVMVRPLKLDEASS